MIQFALFALVVLLGHVGWWIYLYNRINSTALPRKLIKRCEVGIIALIIIIPIVMVLTHWQAIADMLYGLPAQRTPPVLTFWIIWSVGCVLVLVLCGSSLAFGWCRRATSSNTRANACRWPSKSSNH